MVEHLQDSSGTEDSCRLERQWKSCGTAVEQNTEAIYSETGHRTFLEPRLAPCADQPQSQVRELFGSAAMCFPWFLPCEQEKHEFQCFQIFHGYCILYSKRSISHQWWMPQWLECETWICNSSNHDQLQRTMITSRWKISNLPQNQIKGKIVKCPKSQN